MEEYLDEIVDLYFAGLNWKKAIVEIKRKMGLL